MTGTGRAIHWSTVAAVAGVALVAGWVSYVHAYDVVRTHGEHGILARLYPGTIDGLICSASMVLLAAAHKGVKPPPLARWLLAAGIGATLFANILAGADWGPLGAAVAAWPALALVGSYELLMWLVRNGVAAPAPYPQGAPAPGPDGIPAPALDARRTRKPAPVQDRVSDLDAEVYFASDLADGRVPSARQIRRDLHVGQARAAEIRAHLQSVVHPHADAGAPG